MNIGKLNYLNKAKFGQSLIELLISIGLSAILIPAVFAGLAVSREGRPQEKQRFEATALLKEAEEAVRSVREAGWSNISTNGNYYPQVSGSSWILTPCSCPQINGYQRQISITEVQRDSSGQIVENGGTIDPSTKKIITSVSWTTPFNSSVETTGYYQRYLGNTTFNHTTDTDFNGGSHVNTVVSGTGQGADVRLSQSVQAGSDYGNKFRLTATSSIGSMTTTDHKTSLRFTAQESKTVSAIRVYLQTESGTSPSYRYGIQTSTSGNPSGPFLGSGTLTSTSAGWKTITLSPSVSVTAGTIYHIVVEPVGTPTTANNIALRRSTPQNLIYPKTNATDPNANTLFKTSAAGAWAVQNFQPIYELDFSDATSEGNPYETNAQVSVFGANLIGERFTVSGGNRTVNGISFFVRQNAATEPLDSLQVELRTVSPSATVSGGSGILATAAQTTTTYNYFTYTFATPITLTNGTEYRIILKSPSSNSTNFYQVYRIVTTNAANYNLITYDGTNSIYTVSGNSGSTWTDTNNNWDIGGFYFVTQGTTQYATNGDFTSHASGSFDAGATVAFNNIMFSVNTPVSTSISLQVAVSSSPSGPWDYFGSEGNLGTFFTSSGAIPLNRINGRYLRYKATLTSDGTQTPTLNDVSINYSP